MNLQSTDLREEAAAIARTFMTLWLPSKFVCPTEAAELAVVKALADGARSATVTAEVIDLRPAPAGRLGAITARLNEWPGREQVQTNRRHRTIDTSRVRCLWR